MKLCFNLLMLFVLVMSGCRTDSFNDKILDVENNQDVFLEGDVLGLVMNAQGEVLPGVIVSFDNETTYSDQNGYFRINKVAGNSNGSLITFEREGYYSGYKFVYTANNVNAIVEVQMIEKKEVVRFDGNDGINIEIEDGVFIDIPANAVVTESGNIFPGIIELYAHYYDPEETATLESMPGDLRGVNITGGNVQLATYGMIGVEMKARFNSNIILQLGNDLKAKITMPLSNEMVSNAPESIPMWHLNENTGVWEEEGRAELRENYYVGEVSHFSFWNCDAPFEVVEIVGVLTDNVGSPLPNFNLSIVWNETNFTGSGSTNSAGVFKGKVPKSEPLTLRVHHCDDILFEAELGPFSEDEVLNPINVSTGLFDNKLKMNLLDCFNMPLVDGYAIVNDGNRSNILIPNGDGNITVYVSSCSSTEVSFKAFDPNALVNTEELQITLNNTLQNLGDINVCESLTEFIRYTINGGIPNLIEDIEVYIVDDKLIHVRGHEVVSDNLFDFQTKLLDVGIGNLKSVSITGYDENYEHELIECNSIADECVTDVTFDNTPKVNKVLKGMSSGKFEEGYVESTFMVNVDKAFQTGKVEGRSWIDINENGIRDAGDLPFKGASVRIVREDDQEIPNYLDIKEDVVTDENGYYLIEGLQPNIEYKVQFEITSKYKTTTTNQGTDDSIDNDFIKTPFTEFFSHIIIFDDGETVSNVDLGVLKVDMNLSIAISSCAPTAELAYTIIGGIPPYNVELSNGVNNNFMDVDMVFANLPEGTYTLRVEDSAGTTVSLVRTISEYRNIFGYVWLDADNGLPNSFDVQDIVLNDVRVELWNETSLLRFTQSDNTGAYYFASLPPGKYRIKPIIPSNYDFVEMSIGSDSEESDIIISTGFSETIEIVDPCFSMNQVNVGLRE